MTDSTPTVAERITAYLAGGGLFNPEYANHDAVRDLLIDARSNLAAAQEARQRAEERAAACELVAKGKLWLWKNFVDGRPEYWAFDNPFPINLDNGDPQTLGEPCGYALFKPSRVGRTDVSDEEVLRRMDAAIAARAK